MTNRPSEVPPDYPSYIQQLARTYRFLDRYKERCSVEVLRDPSRFNELEDFLWAFFQNCWHLKDWIRNDETLSRALRDSIWHDVKDCRELLIVADLANGSKHFARCPEKEWVGATERQITLSRTSTGQSWTSHEIELATGDRFSALQIAEEAMVAWSRILEQHGMHYFGSALAV